MDLIVTNATLVTAADVIEHCAIGVKDGVVAWIVQASLVPTLDHGCKRIVDVQGAFVTPGGIDAHTHIEQQGSYITTQESDGPITVISADDWDSATRSALAGGTTTVVAFAIQDANTGILQAIDSYQTVAKDKARCDYGFHCIVTNTSEEQLKEALPVAMNSRGVSSVKLYMTYPSLKLSDSQVLSVMYHARAQGITVMIHAENADMIEWLTKDLEERDMTAPWFHGVSRPPLVEAEATNRAVALSELMDVPILLVHVSAPLAIKHIRQAQTRLLPIYGETCPQYAVLDGSEMRRADFEGAKYVCSPPLRDDPKDREHIWAGLANGAFTIWSSDHAPYNYNDKNGKQLGMVINPKKNCQGHFKAIPNGLPGIETRTPLLWSEGVIKKRISMQRFVELNSTNAAKLYGMYPKKGTIAPGSDADFVIWRTADQRAPVTITNERLHHSVDYTPFEGQVLQDWPLAVYLRGQKVYDGETNEVYAKPGYGQYLHRGKSSLAYSGPRNVWPSEWRPLNA